MFNNLIKIQNFNLIRFCGVVSLSLQILDVNDGLF